MSWGEPKFIRASIFCSSSARLINESIPIMFISRNDYNNSPYIYCITKEHLFFGPFFFFEDLIYSNYKAKNNIIKIKLYELIWIEESLNLYGLQSFVQALLV